MPHPAERVLEVRAGTARSRLNSVTNSSVRSRPRLSIARRRPWASPRRVAGMGRIGADPNARRGARVPARAAPGGPRSARASIVGRLRGRLGLRGAAFGAPVGAARSRVGRAASRLRRLRRAARGGLRGRRGFAAGLAPPASPPRASRRRLRRRGLGRGRLRGAPASRRLGPSARRASAPPGSSPRPSARPAWLRRGLGLRPRRLGLRAASAPPGCFGRRAVGRPALAVAPRPDGFARARLAFGLRLRRARTSGRPGRRASARRRVGRRAWRDSAAGRSCRPRRRRPASRDLDGLAAEIGGGVDQLLR